MRKMRNLWNRIYLKIIEFARQTTIHGLPILAAPRLHPLERLFWIIIITSAAIGAIALSYSNMRRYYANPTVVSLQKDYRNWNNPFPSATGCFIYKTDEILVDEFIETTWGINDTHEKYDYYREFIMIVANVSYNTLNEFEAYKDDDELNQLNLLEIAYKVHPELTGTLVTFDTTRRSTWTLVMTEMGVCFTINSKFANMISIKVDGQNSTSDEDDFDMLKCHYLNGLCYARYDSDPEAPMKMYIHSYLDMLHATNDPPLHVKESEELEINFRMQETTAGSNLRYLVPSQRRCRFDDEPLNNDIPAYSTSICYISCRYRLVIKLCGCRPYFYHNMAGKLCDIKGLLCVAKHSEFLTKPPAELGCECPQPCDLIAYLPQVPKVTVWEYGYFEQRITFRWGLLPPTTKFHRDVIFGFEDLVVSIGGTLALFLGVSFISAIEVVFFLLNTLFYIVCPRANKVQPKEKSIQKISKFEKESIQLFKINMEPVNANININNVSDKFKLKKNKKLFMMKENYLGNISK